MFVPGRRSLRVQPGADQSSPALRACPVSNPTSSGPRQPACQKENTMVLTTLDPKTALVVIDLQKASLAFPKVHPVEEVVEHASLLAQAFRSHGLPVVPVSYTHLRAHETRHDLVCRLLLEK